MDSYPSAKIAKKLSLKNLLYGTYYKRVILLLYKFQQLDTTFTNLFVSLVEVIQTIELLFLSSKGSS